jgi:hypothetical protein
MLTLWSTKNSDWNEGGQMIRLSLLKMRQFRDSIHQSCMSHNRSRNLYLYLAVIMAHVQGYSKGRESFPSSIDLPILYTSFKTDLDHKWRLKAEELESRTSMPTTNFSWRPRYHPQDLNTTGTLWRHSIHMITSCNYYVDLIQIP